MIKHLFFHFYNQMLFGKNKDEIYLFKNFNFWGESAFAYKQMLSKQQVMEILSYRKNLATKYNFISFILFVLVYILFLKNDFSFFTVIFYIALFVCVKFFLAKGFTKLYSDYIITKIGKYKLMDFYPVINEEKQVNFLVDLLKKFGYALLVVILYCGSIFLFHNSIKKQLANKNFPLALKTCEVYTILFPKTKLFYNMQAVALFTQKDYKGALANYIKVIKKSSRKFTKEDVIRFSNLLLLEKKLTNPQTALDVFDEYLTKKKMTIQDRTKMLWVKSMFSITAGIPELVIADYDGLLALVKDNDSLNKFYILSDKAYMLYLLGDYKGALAIYDKLIDWAEPNNMKFEKELQRLYAERGFTKMKLKETFDADRDFVFTQLTDEELASFEPTVIEGRFVIEQF